MSAPLVSIIIPVYNGANYMRTAIDSALAQTYPNIEVIVVNDGSRDGGATEKIALGYGDKIRYFAKENGGVSTALNFAIGNMRGEYFSWLSHDDIYYADKIELQLHALKRRGDRTKIVWGNYDLLRETAQEKKPLNPLRQYREALLTDSIFPVVQSLIGGCSLLIPRSHFERVGLFKPELKYTQDYELWFRMFRDQQTVYVDAPLYSCRVHAEQGSQAEREKMRPDESALWVHIAREVTKAEAERMFGSLYEFYRTLYVKMTAFSNAGAVETVLKMFRSETAPPKSLARDRKAREYLWQAGGRDVKICIFCAGYWGLRIFYELLTLGIHVACFADNDAKKHGTAIAQNVNCISFDDLSRVKNDTLVLVAARFAQEVVAQLKAAGFPFVTTKDDFYAAVGEGGSAL
jgi:glycosyltransferase involved in cell wall biosynthesis